MAKVAIFGCGPTGLLTAHAAALNGHDFELFSLKKKSALYGCQYLHTNIPGIPLGGPRLVSYRLNGRPEAYRRKVYGDAWDGSVSPEDLSGDHYAWDIRLAYKWLWAEYATHIRNYVVSPHFATGIDPMISADRKIHFDQYDFVFNTIPRKIWALPEQRNDFLSMHIWAVGDAPDLNKWVPPSMTVNGGPGRTGDFVVCNGNPNPGWYRQSRVFGHMTIEYPGGINGDGAGVSRQKPPLEGVVLVEKPLKIRNGARIAPELIHLGRYGKWEKGALVTDAFREACEVLAPEGSRVGEQIRLF